MSNLNKIEKFQIFCLEKYKDNLNISGDVALNIFLEYDIFSYLDEVYDLLHTQSLDYTYQEIIKYIESKK